MSLSPLMEQKYRALRNRSDNFIDNYLDSDKVVHFSLICPFSKKRIRFPVIHKDCSSRHSELVIFDLYSLLRILNKNPTRIAECPLCNSNFSNDTLVNNCLVDRKLKDCVFREPACFTKIYFYRQDHKPKFEGEIRRFIQLSDTLRQFVEKKIKNFFKMSERTNYDKYIGLIKTEESAQF